MVTRNFKTNPIQTWELTENYWYVVEDDMIGGHAIANTNVKYVSELDFNADEFEVCTMVFKGVAEHIVQKHNYQLQQTIMETYMSNFTESQLTS